MANCVHFWSVPFVWRGLATQECLFCYNRRPAASETTVVRQAEPTTAAEEPRHD